MKCLERRSEGTLLQQRMLTFLPYRLMNKAITPVFAFGLDWSRDTFSGGFLLRSDLDLLPKPII
jgi:hypothetical protein